MYLLGSVAEMTGDMHHTIVSYEKVIAHNKNNHGAYIALGKIYQRQGNYQKAMERFHHLTQLNHTNGEYWAYLGYCFLMQKNVENAYTCYQHALYHVTKAMT